MRRRLPFAPADGGVRVQLSEHEQEVLTNLITDLRHLLMADSHDALRRLKPPAHADNAEAEADYRAMVDDGLLRGRLEMLDVVGGSLSGATLDEAAVAAWMQSLNNLRLVLGERLTLEGADLEHHELGESSAGVLFDWIGQLLGLLVDAASGP